MATNSASGSISRESIDTEEIGPSDKPSGRPPVALTTSATVQSGLIGGYIPFSVSSTTSWSEKWCFVVPMI